MDSQLGYLMARKTLSLCSQASTNSPQENFAALAACFKPLVGGVGHVCRIARAPKPPAQAIG